MFKYENSSIGFSVNPQNGTFSIGAETVDFPGIEEAQIFISGWSRNNHFVIPLVLDSQTAQKRNSNLNLLHHRDQIVFHPNSSIDGLEVQVIVSIMKEQPAVMWKVIAANQGPRPVWIERIDLIGKSDNEHTTNLKINSSPSTLGFFVNGWQSWSFSGITARSSAQMRSNLGLLQNPMVVDAGLKNINRNCSIADMFAVLLDREKEKGCLFGFLSQKEQFGHIALTSWNNPDIRMWADADGVRLDPQEKLQTDWAIFMLVEGSDSENVGSYFDLVARENKIAFQSKVPTGWCSWYQYYQDIDEEIIRENLEVLDTHRADFPLDLVQIDDGFEKQVGDWLAFNPGFPKGVKPLAQEIKKKGFIPGLWLAPFIVHRSSDLYLNHPDWILRKDNGKPVNAGFVWNSLGTALDLTHPAASDYVRTVISKAVQDWQYPYLKLDFLYAAALKGNYSDPTKTRAQVLRGGLEDIRDTAGKKTYLVGCGLPLGPALGLVDSMRIGPDVSGSWKPKYFGVDFPFKNEPSMPSASNSIRNILTRANMHKRWWVNDPDCILVRDQSDLSLQEVQTLATVIAMSGGSMIFSDDLTALSNERLQLAARLLPPLTTRMVVLDWLQNQYPHCLRTKVQSALGEWDLLAQVNWEDKECSASLSCKSFGLPDGTYWISDFWGKRVNRNNDICSLGEFIIPAHGCLLLAVRPLQDGKNQYLGSDLHFSQGIEVKKWTVRKNGARFVLDLDKKVSGNIYLSIPFSPVKIESSDDILNFEKIGQDIYALQVHLEKPLSITINY
ncbi:MAG: alpha-galactosidase [Anaerolineaceae bacterium]|nr:MAG: alpha-galactosidase [Anaerolineaceae bacterium]